MSERNEYGMKPAGWHEHGPLCDCDVCEEKYDSLEYEFGEDDF